jgi:RNA recognition motif-containing protein
VGGIPSHASKEDISQYFSKYGKIIDVKMFVKQLGQSSRPTSTKNRFKGYCIVEVKSQKALERILGEKRHSFEGRMILCSAFKTGSELALHNNERNQRRVIIKQVPANLPEAVLKQLLEKEGGQVEILFPFKTDCSIEYQQNMAQRKRLTYSVMFKSKESAKKLVEIAKITTGTGISIVVERFLNNRSEAGPIPSATSNSNSSSVSDARELSKKLTYQSDRQVSSYTSLFKSHDSSQRRPPGMNTVASEKELISIAGFARLESRDHIIKPTSIRYYLSKKSQGHNEFYEHTTDNIRLCVVKQNPLDARTRQSYQLAY